MIMRMLKLPDGRIRILVQGLARAEIQSVDASGAYIRAQVDVMQEVLPPDRSLEVEALIRNVRASMEKAINLGKNISPEVMAIIAISTTRAAGRLFPRQSRAQGGGRAVGPGYRRHHPAPLASRQ